MSIRQLISEHLVARWRELFYPYRPYMRRNRCVFIHVPRTAGTSIMAALGNRRKARDHLPWHAYYAANRHRFTRYYKFAFVRNPWDRVYSAYRYLKAGGNRKRDLSVAQELGDYGSFEQFVVEGLCRGSFRNHLLFLPQAAFVLGPEGEPMVDFLGRYERLSEDFSEVARTLGIDPELPVLNGEAQAGQGSEPDRHGSREAVDVIGKIYRQDVNAFGYKPPSR